MKYTEYKLYETHKILTNHFNLSVMKKFMYLAVLAGVALVGCTKNERTTELIDSQKEITFTTPVLAVSTKTTEITNTTYPTTSSFNVFAWYNSGVTFEASSASPYMENVQVTYNPSIDDDDPANTSDGTGAWISDPVYYWPKQGVLSFDAYSPNGLTGTVSATAGDGIKVKDHIVDMTLATQQDFLYATRALNKTTSTGGNNATYDGVDIPFKHALAVVKFTAKTAEDYSATTTIKIKTIEIQNINDKGTFNQNESSSNPAWSAQTGSNKYVALEKGTYDLSNELNNTTATPVGETVIVLPQNFTASTQKLHIEYYIKTIATDSKALLQKADLYFHNTTPLTDDNKWEMGKRYTYNLVIGLDKIYFAPSVTDWTDVNVTVPQI